MLIGVVLHPGHRKPVAYTTTQEEENARHSATRCRLRQDPRVRVGELRQFYEVDTDSAYWAMRVAVRRFRSETRHLRNVLGRPRQR